MISSTRSLCQIILIAVLASLVLSFFRDNKPIESTQEFIKTCGGISGFIAFIWRIVDALQRFLHVELTITQENGAVIAKTMVENKGTLKKEIINSFLVVGPENENPIDTVNAMLRVPQIKHTNELKDVNKSSLPLSGNAGRALIPIDFYYSENVWIADERIGYGVPLDISQIPPETPYAVRFFIFAENHLHRSTEATFVLPKK